MRHPDRENDHIAARLLYFALPFLLVVSVPAWSGIPFNCNQLPDTGKSPQAFRGALRLGSTNGADIFRCGEEIAPTPETCELANRTYPPRESVCINSETQFTGDYLPAVRGANLDIYASDLFVPPNWAVDFGLDGQTWMLVWDHLDEPAPGECVGYYAAQSDVLIVGESGNITTRPCEEGTSSLSCVDPVIPADASACNPQVGTPLGDIANIGGLAPVPVPVVDFVLGAGFSDPDLSIGLDWPPACASTSHDGALDPVIGYRLEVYADADGNGQADIPDNCDTAGSVFFPLVDIAPVAKLDDFIPDRLGDAGTNAVIIGQADLVAAGIADPPSLESLSFRLRVLFLDDRLSPLGLGGLDGNIDPVISFPSARSQILSLESGGCLDADGDGFGQPGHPLCPAGDQADCDDADPAVNPAALEVPDGIDNNCNGQVDEVSIDAACEIVPSAVNLQSQGSGLTIKTTLTDLSTGELLDPSVLAPVHISRVSSPGIGDIILPVAHAEPGCDSLTEDGIWESVTDRNLTGAFSLTLRFKNPSDGVCETLDGNRQDIIALLLDVPNGETTQICYRSTYPGAPAAFECCGEVSVTNHGNR